MGIPNSILVYHPSPENSFGSDGYYEINSSAHFSYFDNNTDWTLHYSDDEINWGRIPGLDVDSIYDTANLSEKTTLNFTAQDDGFYMVKYSMDTLLKSYELFEDSNYVRLEFPVQGKNGSYVTFFDWNDIIESNISNVHCSCDFEDNYFSFLVTTDFLESGTFMSIDPTFFGGQTGGTTYSAEDNILCLKATMGATGGTADNSRQETHPALLAFRVRLVELLSPQPTTL